MPALAAFVAVASSRVRTPSLPRAPGVQAALEATISPPTGVIGTTFTAALTGDRGNPSGSIAYQWKLNGSNISGATTSFYTAIVPGTLTVEITVTNASGSPSDVSDGVVISAISDGDAMLLEGGDALLLENGDNLLLEVPPDTGPPGIGAMVIGSTFEIA